MAKRQCFACKVKIQDFDYKDASLSRHLSTRARIKTRRETRLCARHQRNMAQAVKRARFLALLPYVREQSFKS